MKTVIQRVNNAAVSIDNKVKAAIDKGLLVLVGIEDTDTEKDIEYLSKKIVALRIFDDENGVMNKSVTDINGEILLISQFTLMADTRKGNRPSYIKAAKPDVAIPIYERFIKKLTLDFGKEIQTGTFGADMKISLLNNGPVTIIIDSKE